MLRCSLTLAKIAIIFSTVVYCGYAAAEDARKILNKCIRNHGGKERFTEIRDIFAKMDVVTYAREGNIESLFYEYFRKPDKLRIEIHPLVEAPTKIGWDGKTAWHMVKDKLESTQDEKLIKRIRESIRFLKLMILTNLFEQGTVFRYERYIRKKKFGVHVISRIDKSKEEIKLYISASSFVLLGAEFQWSGSENLFRITFSKHKWINGLYLPIRAKLYSGKQLVMSVRLKLVKVNALRNGNSFFANLNEKANLQRWRRK